MLIDFLKTTRSKDDLRITLEVLQEYWSLRSHMEDVWLSGSVMANDQLLAIGELLDFLVHGTPLSESTARELEIQKEREESA